MKKKIIVLVVLFSLLITVIGHSTSPYGVTIGGDSAPKISSYKVMRSTFNKKEVNDPYLKNQWAIGFTKSEEVWRIVEQKKEISVAVVDSGVDYNHPDLKNRVLVDKGYNFISNNKNTMDDLGHGTQVAGIIAAEAGNGKGITGIVGPLDVKIIPIKVLDKSGSGPSDIVAKGITYAVDAKADIINISIDFEEHDSEIESALEYAKKMGVFVVVAAGNSNNNCDLYSPAGDNGAYTVAAITSSYKRAYFSSYGSSVKVTAPGVEVLTTTLGGKYDVESGTSMSAPIVSGVAAMIKAENPLLGPSGIANIINSTATDVMDKGIDKKSGYGLPNAYKAVLAAKK